MTESTKPAAKPTEVKPAEKKEAVTAAVVTPHAPAPLVNAIPAGAMDPNEVLPGYGPLEGSPKEDDPTQLANPNNPNSPITKPVNPSNPANMPAMQSEKTPSEVAKQVPDVPPVVVADPFKSEKTELLGKIKSFLDAAGGESNIGPQSEYWAAVARYRFLMNP